VILGEGDLLSRVGIVVFRVRIDACKSEHVPDQRRGDGLQAFVNRTLSEVFEKPRNQRWPIGAGAYYISGDGKRAITKTRDNIVKAAILAFQLASGSQRWAETDDLRTN
jgi:hypothetical protein